MSYTVCEPDCDQGRDAILELWRRNLPESSPKRFGWLYEAGPATGLLLRADFDKVVGSAGLMRRTMCAFGKPLVAGQAIDLNVDKDHRTIGPAIGLSRAVLETVTRGELALIYAFPNKQSEAVLRRLGYRAIGDLGRWVRPLSCRAVLRRRSWPKGLSGTVASLLDPLLRLRAREILYRRPAGLRVEPAAGFDARFDRLYEAVSRRLPIVGERTAAYLQWRFLRSPGPRHHVLCLYDAQGELLAYLVYNRREDTVYVADFLYGEATHLDVLLTEFLHLMRRQGAEAVVVVYFGHHQVCESLTGLGFWKRPSHWKAMVYTDPRGGDAFGDRLVTPEDWYFTRADVDTDD